MNGATVTPQEALRRLNDSRAELDKLSDTLFRVNQRLDEVEKAYSDFVDDYEVTMYLASEKEGGRRLPSEAMRQKLARREMDPELLGTRDGLLRKRSRIKERISDVKATVEADRSILSALKEAA